MVLTQILGFVLIVVGLALLVVPRLSTSSSVAFPGVTISAPASVLVLIVGVAVFLFPYSPWWPGDGAKASPSPSFATTSPAPSTETASSSTPGQSGSPTTETPSPTVTPGPTASPTVAPADVLPTNVASDCIPYDPATLSIEDLGADGWRLNSSTSAMLLTDTQADAEKALALARLHTQQCFIGRANQRSDRSRYITTFWTGPGATVVVIPSDAIPSPDCIQYDPSNLSIEDLGAIGWRLNSGPIAMVLADNEQDANLLQGLATHYHQQCFIGRGNSRSDRSRYIVDYWN